MDGEGQPIFDALKGNTNLFLMLCGHVDGEGFRHEVLPDGRVIDLLLADYQSYANGGNGYLRCLMFSPSNNQIRVTTYSPRVGGSLTDRTASSRSTMPCSRPRRRSSPSARTRA